MICKILKNGKPQYGLIKLRKDEMKEYYPDINKIKKKLHWLPNKKFSQSLKLVISYYKKLNSK